MNSMMLKLPKRPMPNSMEVNLTEDISDLILLLKEIDPLEDHSEEVEVDSEEVAEVDSEEVAEVDSEEDPLETQETQLLISVKTIKTPRKVPSELSKERKSPSD